MAQDPLPDPVADSGRPLFDLPPDRLGARLHEEVFGALPSATARALDDVRVAAAVRPLLARRWRPAQLAARVGALPVSADPVAAVVAFLGQLLERDSPQQAWDGGRAARERERAEQDRRGTQAASEQVRAHWLAEARRSLGLPSRPRVVPVSRPPAVCATCGRTGEFFVTRQVRLCVACVELLGSGRARLAVDARAG